VTFAINLVTEEILEYVDYIVTGNLTADAWKKTFVGPEWLTGTIDYLYPDGSIDDLKTGRWPVDPETSGQLRSYMLFPWLRAGKPIKWSRFASITQWEKYPQHGLPRRTSAIIRGFGMMMHLEDLRYAVTHPDEVNPGDEQCRFCECRPNCPAHVDKDKQLACPRCGAEPDENCTCYY
jgi:hypothetical protein